MILQTLLFVGFKILAEVLTLSIFPTDIFDYCRKSARKYDKFAPFPENALFADDILEEEKNPGAEKEEETEGAEEEGDAFRENSDIENEEEEEVDIYWQKFIDNSSNMFCSIFNFSFLFWKTI